MWNGYFKISEATAARRRMEIRCVDATDLYTPETGEAGGQPEYSVNGGAWASTAAVLVAVGNGRYYVELTAAELGTLGKIAVRYKSANTAEAQAEAMVGAADIFDAVRLGLTGLANAVAGATGGLPLVDASGAVKLQSGTGANQLDLDSGRVNVGKIDDSASAAELLALSANSMILLTVNNSAFTPTLTQCEFTELTEATATHYVDRPVLFLTGPLAGQARAITGYSKTGSFGKVTVEAFTDVPVSGNLALML